MSDMLKKAQEVESYVIDMRRYFHENPELSCQEFKTQEKIMEELDALGIPYEKAGSTSLIAKINAGKGSKTVALRADTDALPVIEQSGVPFTSKNPGVMHACGHDAHTAMLLGAAKILAGMKDELPGEVRLFFRKAKKCSLAQIRSLLPAAWKAWTRSLACMACQAWKLVSMI